MVRRAHSSCAPNSIVCLRFNEKTVQKTEKKRKFNHLKYIFKNINLLSGKIYRYQVYLKLQYCTYLDRFENVETNEKIQTVRDNDRLYKVINKRTITAFTHIKYTI